MQTSNKRKASTKRPSRSRFQIGLVPPPPPLIPFIASDQLEENGGRTTVFQRLLMKEQGKRMTQQSDSTPLVVLEGTGDSQDQISTTSHSDSEHTIYEVVDMDMASDEEFVDSANNLPSSSNVQIHASSSQQYVSVNKRKPVAHVHPTRHEDAPEVIQLSDTPEPSPINDIVTINGDFDDSSSDCIVLEDLTMIDEVGESMIQSPPAKKAAIANQSFSENDDDVIEQPKDCLSIGTLSAFSKITRRWHTLQSSPAKRNHPCNFRICSYNVLCQNTIATTKYLYGHLKNNPFYLTWGHRWSLLDAELEHIDADIYGLQEVQFDHYQRYFLPSMTNRGYSGHYKRKTDAKTYTDGCAIFYKKDKFKSIDYKVVEYFVEDNTNMDRHQIGQILRLRCKKNQQDLIVANTHIIFNTSRGDIKIGQLAMLIANIHQMVNESPCPVVITGDFNMAPHSFVYKYVVNGSVFLHGLPRNELSGQVEKTSKGGAVVLASDIIPKKAMIGRDSMFIADVARLIDEHYFTHPLKLASVHNHFTSDGGEKEVSTYHKSADNPDFIFYSILKTDNNTTANQTHVYELSQLRLLRRYSLPGISSLNSTLGPWPNKYVPSDHIPLIAEFALCKTS